MADITVTIELIIMSNKTDAATAAYKNSNLWITRGKADRKNNQKMYHSMYEKDGLIQRSR